MSIAAVTDSNSLTGNQSSNVSSIETNNTAVCAHDQPHQEQIITIPTPPQAPTKNHLMKITLVEKTKQSLPTLSTPWMNKIQRGFVYVALFLGLFAIIVQSSIVAPAMSKIATEMHDIENQTWVAIAFFLGLNCAQAIAGKVNKTETAFLYITSQLKAAVYSL